LLSERSQKRKAARISKEANVRCSLKIIENRNVIHDSNYYFSGGIENSFSGKYLWYLSQKVSTPWINLTHVYKSLNLSKDRFDEIFGNLEAFLQHLMVCSKQRN
jgi:hypothetical protein